MVADLWRDVGGCADSLSNARTLVDRGAAVQASEVSRASAIVRIALGRASGCPRERHRPQVGGVVVVLTHCPVRSTSRNRQLELPRPDKNAQRRGGKRPRAGRKPKGLRAGVTHAKRVEIDPTKPLHITLRVVAAVAALRSTKAYRAIRHALQTSAFNQLGLRICHFSVQRNHLHLICEADDKRSLARGMQSFKISAAKQLNCELGRSGTVFADRYHVEILATPTQASHAISYVLNNWRKHGEHRHTAGLYRGRIDPYSSGAQFYGWAAPRWRTSIYPKGYERAAIAAPLTWMLGVGYLRGKPISVFAVPRRIATQQS